MLSQYPRGGLNRDSSVLAVVPHFRCERWLASCLESLVNQTRPLNGIVVVDDSSDEPPTAIVAQFPQVTLLTSDENVGPYALIQAVIDSTSHDAYLFQDADDWSAPDRLEILLAEAERSGAELVGCQGIRIISDEWEALPYIEPLDVNAALAVHPVRIPLHHPTSLVARDLVVRVGGFATGLRFWGDAEFLRRAVYVARAVNVPRFCYYYRMREGSLTSDPDTGLRSPARQELWTIQRERAELNASLVASGKPPILEPMATADPVTLTHVTGPSLATSETTGMREVVRARQPRAGHDERRRNPASAGVELTEQGADRHDLPARPIFVLGSLRSGASLLTWSLGQHRNILPLLDNSWLDPFAANLEETYAAAVRNRSTSQLDIMGIEIEDFYEHFGETINRLLLAGARSGGMDHGASDRSEPEVATAGVSGMDRRGRWIDGSPVNCFNVVGLRRLFPNARFIHMVRDAGGVVETLTNEEKRRSFRSHWRQYTETEAYEHWLETVEAGFRAERAYGSEVVLRVRRDDLVEDADATLRRCLEFVGEPFSQACLRAFE